MKRLPIIAALVALLFVSGCAGMTAQQRQDIRADVVVGLGILAAGVAGMPSADPTLAYWSKYAAGVLHKAGGPEALRPTAPVSPAAQ